MRHDLFISYRRSQQAAVLPVIKTLEDAGIRCFLDTAEIDTLAAFPEVLRRAIAEAKQVLALACQCEGNTAIPQTFYRNLTGLPAEELRAVDALLQLLVQLSGSEQKVKNG